MFGARFSGTAGCVHVLSTGRKLLSRSFVLLAVPVCVLAQQYFADVPPTMPYFNTVNRMYQLGITGGCSPGYYCPNDATLRWQMAIFVIRALFGGDNFSYPLTPYFPDDVPATHSAFKWIQKMAELGITRGCSLTAYCPDQATSYEAAAIFAIRASQLKPGNPIYPGYVTDNFGDYSQEAYVPLDMPSSATSFKFVQKIRDQGTIATACGERNFCPSGTLTRAEASYYVIRGIIGDYPAMRKISQNAGSGDVWEPVIARGSTTWVAGWTEVPHDISQPLVTYLSAWDPAQQKWGNPHALPPFGVSTFDLHITWDPYTNGGRFVYVLVDAFRNVQIGFSTDASGTNWTSPPNPALAGFPVSWDFSSVAVDSTGRILVAASNSNTSDLSIYGAISTDGGRTFSQPVRIVGPTASTNYLFSRVAAISDRFEVFSLLTQAPQTTPFSLRRFESTGGLTWNDMGYLSPNLGSPPNNSTQQACTPGSPTDNCELVFFAPTLDAKGDPGRGRWTVVAPTAYGTKTNATIWTSDRGSGPVNQQPYDEFLSTGTVSSDGSYWVSYLTFTLCYDASSGGDGSKSASNVYSQTIHFPPGGYTGATTSSGIAPVRWRNTGTPNSSAVRCGSLGVPVPCYAAGDYAIMAADGNIMSAPLIQQSPFQRNDLHTIFLQDFSGAFYSPYSLPRPAYLQTSQRNELFGSVPAPPIADVAATSGYDPPALVAVKPAPTNQFRPNFVPLPAGGDFGGLSAPIPASAYGVPPSKWSPPPVAPPAKK
jgi:hypothetical protein